MAQECVEAIQNTSRSCVALMGCPVQRFESSDRSGWLEAVLQRLFKKTAQHLRIARCADQFDPWPGAVAWHLSFLHHLCQHLARDRRFDGLQSKLELLLMTLRFPCARPNRLSPGLRQIVNAQPYAIIQK